MSESEGSTANGHGENFKYFAFISYSHQDNRDRRAADAADASKRIRWAD